MIDYYQILRVSPEASLETLQRSYRQRAKQIHPDLYHGDDPRERQKRQKQFIQLTQAYDTLSDPKRRQRYDLQFRKTRAQTRHGAHQKTQSTTSSSSTFRTSQTASASGQRTTASGQHSFSRKPPDTDASLDDLLDDVETLLKRFGLTLRDPLEMLLDWARRVFEEVMAVWTDDEPVSGNRTDSSEQEPFSRHASRSHASMLDEIEAELKRMKQQYHATGNTSRSGTAPSGSHRSGTAKDSGRSIDEELQMLKQKYGKL